MADHDLVAEMEEAGWKHGWLGVRCPNQWKCQIGCACHRLAPGALADDLAAHYKIEAWTKQVPAHQEYAPLWTRGILGYEDLPQDPRVTIAHAPPN